MSHALLRSLALILIVVVPTMAEDRTTAQLLAAINAVEMPKVPEDRGDRGAMQQYILKRQKAVEARSDLIGRLYKLDPDAPEVAKLIGERWQVALFPGAKGEAIKAEIDDVLARSKNEKLVAEAAFLRAFLGFRKAGTSSTGEQLLSIADEFIKRAPRDPRGEMFLVTAGAKMTDEASKEAINRRIEKEYPDSAIARQKVGERRLRDAVGQPFEIEFTEAIRGGSVSMATLKGKVIIVDFWATWCGPCVGEMPTMKDLYARYRGQGVEFIGVSLDRPRDQGGFDALKAFVEKNKIDWPQYYEGKPSATDFATFWGIDSIPTVFAIGADGKIASTQARGSLPELIPRLLEEAGRGKPTQAKP